MVTCSVREFVRAVYLVSFGAGLFVPLHHPRTTFLAHTAHVRLVSLSTSRLTFTSCALTSIWDSYPSILSHFFFSRIHPLATAPYKCFIPCGSRNSTKWILGHIGLYYVHLQSSHSHARKFLAYHSCHMLVNQNHVWTQMVGYDKRHI